MESQLVHHFYKILIYTHNEKTWDGRDLNLSLPWSFPLPPLFLRHYFFLHHQLFPLSPPQLRPILSSQQMNIWFNLNLFFLHHTSNLSITEYFVLARKVLLPWSLFISSNKQAWTKYEQRKWQCFSQVTAKQCPLLRCKTHFTIVTKLYSLLKNDLVKINSNLQEIESWIVECQCAIEFFKVFW